MEFTSRLLESKINKQEFFIEVVKNINNGLGTNVHSLQSRTKVNFFKMMVDSILEYEAEKVDYPRNIIVDGKEWKTYNIARKLFSHLMEELVAFGLIRKEKEQGKGSPVVYHDTFYVTEKGNATMIRLGGWE